MTGFDSQLPSVRMISEVACDDNSGACKLEQSTMLDNRHFHLRFQDVQDDEQHFVNTVALKYRFSNYDVVSSSSALRVLGDPLSCKLNSSASGDIGAVERSCAVRAISETYDIVLDSGSDATVLPAFMLSSGMGTPSPVQASELRDAQGNSIGVSEVRDILFELTTQGGKCVRIKDRAHFSDVVENPIISYGKLLRRGWGILPSEDGRFLVHSSGHQIPVQFRNNSLTINGVVRMVRDEVRTIQVDVPKSWRALRAGWYDLPNGFPACVSQAQNYVDASQTFLVHEWPYRTTVAMDDRECWHVIELCEKLFYMDDRAKPISGNYQRLLTLLSKEVCSIADFGMGVTDSHEQRSAAASGSRERPVVAEQVPVQPQGSGQQRSSTGTELNSSSSPMDVQQNPIPESIDVHADDEATGLMIAGVHVSVNSAISVLRAACQSLQISQSGSKSKLWRRIVAHLDKQKILAETAAATETLESSTRRPVSVQVAERPTDEAAIRQHQLTHQPYAAWCEACVMSKGRPDRHTQNPERVQQHEIPMISMDFCYTGKTLEAVTEKSVGDKLIALVLHDSHSGAVHCIPTHSKDAVQHMVRETLAFHRFLGYGDVCLRADQEPALLVVETAVQRTIQRMGFRVTTENSKLLDHGSNSWAEKAIDRIRSMASVLLHHIKLVMEFDVPVQHPLFSWAFVHGSWLLNRFSAIAGTTPYEIISGHAYRGRLCQFGEPVMAYIGDSLKKKGDPKWKPSIFLTKVVNNDMFLVQCEDSLKLTRSVKAIFQNWKEHVGIYRTLVSQPWHIEGVLGNRTEPVAKAYLGNPAAIPLDDEAASVPDDEAANVHDLEVQQPSAPPPPDVEIPHVVDPENPGRKMRRMAPPPSAVVSAPATPPMTVEAAEVTSQSVAMEADGAEQAGTLTGPTPPAGETLPMEESASLTMRDAPTVEEPDAKRQKLTVRQVGEENLSHVDMENWEYWSGQDLNFPMSDDEQGFDSDAVGSDFGANLEPENEPSQMDAILWQPISELEPTLDDETLRMIDDYADHVEIQRLTKMTVLCSKEEYSGTLGKPLSAKMVRAWRRKVQDIKDDSGKTVEKRPGWYRRSRLVAREFNWLQHRDDIYSPASSTAVTKIFPALAMSDGFVVDGVLGSLDIQDAFLQVPQEQPREVRLGDCAFVILKCLPGQRDASKLWYSFFVQKLQKCMNAVVCAEQPCILKIGTDGVLLLHVDDIMFHGRERWVVETLIPQLEAEFKLTHTYVPRETGGSFEFLKRTHMLEPGYSKLTISSENKHVTTILEKFTKADGGKVPKMFKSPCVSSSGFNPSGAKLLSEEMASEFRSLVGIAMYLSQHRNDIQFCVKTLATDLKSPTWVSWDRLRRLAGYLRFSQDFAISMEKSCKGTTFLERQFHSNHEAKTDKRNCIEVFTNSDWSGGGDFRSTSSAVHTLNGLVTFTTCRTQKAISLSSTEAEWYSASSGVCDSMYLRHIVDFITEGDIDEVILHVDNSAVRMLSLKPGSGRLRHIHGRSLWLQSKVASGILAIKQVKTLFNVANLNTKALARERFMALLYMLGFVAKNGPVGSDEFTRLQSKELVKQQVRLISSSLQVDALQNPGQHESNKVAKNILRIISTYSLLQLGECLNVDTACAVYQTSCTWMLVFSTWCLSRFSLLGVIFLALVVGADGMDENQSEEALSPMLSPMIKCAGVVTLPILVWLYVCAMADTSDDETSHETSDPEPEPETHTLVPERGHGTVTNIVKLYMCISACVAEARSLLNNPDEGIQEQATVIHEELIDMYERCERDRRIDAEVVNVVQILSDSLQYLNPEFNIPMDEVEEEPDIEFFIPRDMPVIYSTLELPPPFEHHSPEHMIQWMIERLTRRISFCIRNGQFRRCKLNTTRRAIMVSLMKLVRDNPDPTTRARALFIMNDITDISDSDAE